MKQNFRNQIYAATFPFLQPKPDTIDPRVFDAGPLDPGFNPQRPNTPLPIDTGDAEPEKIVQGKSFEARMENEGVITPQMPEVTAASADPNASLGQNVPSDSPISQVESINNSNNPVQGKSYDARTLYENGQNLPQNKNTEFSSLQNPADFIAAMTPQTAASEKPALSQFDLAQKEYEQALAEKPKKQNPWMQALFLGLQGVSHVLNRNDNSEYEFLGNAKHKNKVRAAAERFAPLQQQRDRQIASDRQQEEFTNKQNLVKAQTQNIIDDNELARLESEREKNEFVVKSKEGKRKSFYTRNKYFDPSKVTDAQRTEIAGFDETPESVGKYDFTNPVVRPIGDSVYQFDPTTKTWQDSGLPKDGSKEIVDYEVKDPSTGLVSKYSTTSEKAAGLKQSFVNAGLMIEAANTRQEKQLAQQNSQFTQRFKLDKAKFEQSKKEFDTQINLRQQALIDAKDARAKGDERAAQAADNRAKALEARLVQMRITTVNGNLDEEQEKDLLQRIDNLGIK